MKMSWITPAPFVDVDLPIIAELGKENEIYWQIVIIGKLSDDMKDYIESHLNEANHIVYDYVEIPYRVFDLRVLGIYRKVLKRAKAFMPDLYYTSDPMAPYGAVLYRLHFPRKRTIAACHNVSTPKGANQYVYNRIYTDLHLRTFRNIQVFCELQKDLLLNKYPKKNVLMAPLAIKDYGEPTLNKLFEENKIVFLFFGYIRPYKRVDLLINAAQKVYENGFKNFIVKIAGSCKNWSTYERLIKYPELFDLRIEQIPNADVADLFASSDYFIMPYQDIAQSGAITVAYRYNLPIILSDLPQFKPFGVDGETGYFFRSQDVRDLEDKMIALLKGGAKLNQILKGGLRDFVERYYSTTAIANKYRRFFENLFQNRNNG